MTPEVKQRIKQIRQGIVPEGYIKDKDGIYPCDWTAKKIGQWLKLAERPIVLKDEGEYQLVTVRRGFVGVDSRGSFLGKNVLVKNYFIVKTGDFIISKRQIAHGACGIVPPELDGAVVSNEYNVFLPQDGTNTQMFNLMMQLPHYKRLFYLMSDGVHIEKLLFKTQDWMKRTLAMPLLKEQKKIAEILSTQDKAIELQERKIEELKRFKRGCLERMFPRKGQKVPEKRFPGFTGDWEQRKLGELAEIKDSARIPNAEWSESGIPYIRASDITNESLHGVLFISLERYEYYKNKTGAPMQGDVLFNGGGEIGKSLLNADNKPIYVQGGAVLYARTSMSKVLDGQYLKSYFETAQAKDYIDAASAGGTIKHFTLKPSQEMPVQYPKVSEQRLIGTYFRHLDNLITLHQRKLEEMKKLKKALMQLLLTGIVRVKA